MDPAFFSLIFSFPFQYLTSSIIHAAINSTMFLLRVHRSLLLSFLTCPTVLSLSPFRNLPSLFSTYTFLGPSKDCSRPFIHSTTLFQIPDIRSCPTSTWVDYIIFGTLQERNDTDTACYMLDGIKQNTVQSYANFICNNRK